MITSYKLNRYYKVCSLLMCLLLVTFIASLVIGINSIGFSIINCLAFGYMGLYALYILVLCMKDTVQCPFVVTYDSSADYLQMIAPTHFIEVENVRTSIRSIRAGNLFGLHFVRVKTIEKTYTLFLNREEVVAFKADIHYGSNVNNMYVSTGHTDIARARKRNIG